ncbi:MAG: hypothetical protein ACKOCT_10325, partial [Alphaproteobacteria bacterium]
MEVGLPEEDRALRVAAHPPVEGLACRHSPSQFDRGTCTPGVAVGMARELESLAESSGGRLGDGVADAKRCGECG